ncbi:MAG: hypothetical protein WBM13_03745 [Bacteroidia bacterium]
MKKLIFTLAVLSSIVALNSCGTDTNQTTANSNNNNTESAANNNVWAETVESKTIFIKPEGWDDEYWNSVNKNLNKDALFNTIVEAVLSGERKAYDIFTDSVLTINEVKELVRTNVNDSINQYNEVKIGANDLSLVRMREKWTFDKEKFRLEKKVTRIDLVYKKLDLSGEYIGDKPLFYVNLEYN